MRRIVKIVVVASLALLGAAASAQSQTRTYKGTLSLGIRGWGSVKLSRGFAKRATFTCFVNYDVALSSCPGGKGLINQRRVVLIEKTPFQGFTFAGWRGACRGKKPTCVIDMAGVHRNASGRRNPRVRAMFVPVGPGLTRDNPLPVGTTAAVNQDATVRVNSVMPNPSQLSPPPPTGDAYFAANLTVTYTGSVGVNYEGSYQVIGSHNTPYTIPPDRDRCPAGPPGPDLPIGTFLTPGQSETGWLCWTIAADDESSLELLFGASASMTEPFPAHWFALH